MVSSGATLPFPAYLYEVPLHPSQFWPGCKQISRERDTPPGVRHPSSNPEGIQDSEEEPPWLDTYARSSTTTDDQSTPRYVRVAPIVCARYNANKAIEFRISSLPGNQGLEEPRGPKPKRTSQIGAPPGPRSPAGQRLSYTTGTIYGVGIRSGVHQLSRISAGRRRQRLESALGAPWGISLRPIRPLTAWTSPAIHGMLGTGDYLARLLYVRLPRQPTWHLGRIRRTRLLRHSEGQSSSATLHTSF